MSSINWSEVLAIFVGFGTFFIYLMSRLDGVKKDLIEKIEGLQKDINRVDSKVSNIEGQITQMTRPNVVPIKRRQRDPLDDEPKEN